MPSTPNIILTKMLDRLFAGLASGPNLNCRPHSSRQRIDWTQFAKLQDVSPADALRQLLSDSQAAKLQARVTAPKSVGKPALPKKRPATGAASSTAPSATEQPAKGDAADDVLSPAEQRQRDEWTAQQGLLTKLRGLAEDAREYEQDTGVHVLHVGFPLLSLPPGSSGSLKSAAIGTKRLLAPIAFIPVKLELRAGLNPVVAIGGLHDGADFLVPNEALFAWLECQTGLQIFPEPTDAALNVVDRSAIQRSDRGAISDDQSLIEAPPQSAATPEPQSEPAPESIRASSTESSSDPEAESLDTESPDTATAGASTSLNPWDEVADLVRRVAAALHLPPCDFTAKSLTELRSAPRTDDENPKAEIVAAAVLGLFPMNNQGLLRDMQAMVIDPASLRGPVQSFLSANALLGEETEDGSSDSGGSEDQIESVDAKPQLPVSSLTPSHRTFDTERLVTIADPCQSRAVRLARECQGLVIHGPPGTGKSQTITNIIGDHLARGERVLMVCDKRTALDVVARRLEHIGLGSLCALIHDPQHDQRNLYRQVREQLEELSSTSVRNRAESQLKTLDRQLQKSHDTLARAWSLVMSPDPERHVSFHQRMGEWLETALPLLATTMTNPQDGAASTPAAKVATTNSAPTPPRSGRRSRGAPVEVQPAPDPVNVELFDAHLSEVRDIVSRAIEIRLATHPWKECVGMSLSAFLSRPASQVREDMAAIVAAAVDLDQTRNDVIPAFQLPDDFANTATTEQSSTAATGFSQQLTARQDLAARLRDCLDDIDPAVRRSWVDASGAEIEFARQRLVEAKVARDTIESGPLDLELRMIFSGGNPTAASISAQIGALEAYLSVCDAWYSWLAFGVRARVNAVLRAYGLPPGKPSAERLLNFLNGVIARLIVQMTVTELTERVESAARKNNGKKGTRKGERQKATRTTSRNESDVPDPPTKPLDDDALRQNWDRVDLLTQILHDCDHLPGLTSLSDQVRTALIDDDHAFVTALEASAPRAEVLEELRLELTASNLFREHWLRDGLQRLCRGESITGELQSLADSLDSLGEVLRIQSMLAEFPASLRILIERVLATATDVDVAMTAVRHQVLSSDIEHWLKSNPQLQALDGTQLTNLHREVHRLQSEKQPRVRDLILDLWIGRQRERLLSLTGSRLSGLGADLRRRLTTRGERAMRLRQVIAVGSKIDGGDPLFDLRPVWMASPETVAQIFPRAELFDVVIFDEASQCRLEEALPVLTRAKRVVIAGDPKQLPPTRFFESAVITSDNTDIETDQDLFEAHQSEVEDLLTAALSLDIQESHLDVHYRSRNADLVEFSNRQFYGSRLQAIPGHPRNRIRFAPITLYHVAGVYDERTNAAEAAQVCQIVADLLRRSEPPSIGIACFNLTQRDLILDTLAELAAEDSDFAGRLATARSRIGAGAFEGLFVKNLENVQGDERDHMIISTTYGPDKQGRFYRRFGPLGQAGGGRRLNVLITRAREEVHLVTSIPTELYRNLPPIPEGQHPGGGWLLFAYLDYAERLAQGYSQWRAETPAGDSSAPARTIERPSRTPSQFARQLARLIATRHNVGSDIHWGNDGFCVDVAFHHPRHPEDRTLGLLCDGTRFQYADDPVAWDVFRMAILEGQGWQLSRCWTPEFFRDPAGFLRQFVAEASRIADTDPDPDAIPVEPVKP